MSSKVLIVLATGFEEIEAVTIVDILRRANIDITVTGLNPDAVTGSHNITISCDKYYEDVNINEYDFIVLPGGQPGSNNLKSDSIIQKWLQHFKGQNKWIGAVCSAPTVLKDANILEDIKITSYPADKNAFNQSNYSEKDVVVDQNIITSRGVGTAIQFSLELVNIIKDKKTSNEIAKKILWKQT